MFMCAPIGRESRKSSFRRLNDPLEIRDTDQFVPFLMDAPQGPGPFSAMPSESGPGLIEKDMIR